ncbi:type VI secretion system Vgr family protein [Bordetella genomosp. 13]|uniref:Type VI secretion protein Vgr n=1 Tax=Bordetella genomosp. 13 TaxID=463040 RepID=A0A1W6ZHG9_9BORD|nr:type VI secretion system tip protein VgrG [Bordetella genomosp. 13]ARP96705.1 type VI secretion protein Vgr [Bordetella genomosp. 13]
MNRHVVLKISQPELEFRALSGTESMSALFEFELEMTSPSYSLDLRQMLGNPVTLEIALEPMGTRYLNGQITRCTLVGRASPTSRHYVYRATVRPWLWYLTQTVDSKIFQGKTVPEVLQDVLSEYGFPVETRLGGGYRQWEYCVQYQETDFNFISRLMEHEGIHYWFEHTDGKHTLVLGDETAQHQPLDGDPLLPYIGPDRLTQPIREYVSYWAPAEQITPGKFATVDYDFKKPTASLDALRSNPGQYAHGDLEVYEWMGGYTEPDQGERYSLVQLEALQVQQATVEGLSNARAMTTGRTFTLRNHPRNVENREYLVHRVSYDIQETDYSSNDETAHVFEVRFSVIPSSTTFRPQRVTPHPRTHGPQTARVVGKAGEELWTDQYGRIKVQFHWDRYGQKNENSSCWVRVSSPWAGGGFGGIQMPRVNDEVIVDFIGGQPDRPIVIGRVYNASNMPPWELPANATQSGFLSRSKNGDPGTANALMFEDASGQERIWLHAERNMDTEVEANETHSVDLNRSTTIGVDDTLMVVGARTTTVQGQETETFMSGADRTVTGPVNETITGDETRTLTGNFIEDITGNVDQTIVGDVTETTTGNVTRTITGNVVDETTGDVDETITGNLTQETTGDVNRTITGAVTDTTTGDVNATVTGNTTRTFNGTIDETVTGQYTITAPTGMTVDTPNWKVTNASNTTHWYTKHLVATSWKATATGVEADVYGLRGQVFGVNFQWSAVKLDYFDFRNDGGKTRIVMNVLEAYSTAATMGMGGPWVNMRALHLLG